jgi:hypothetical protein
MPIEPEQHAFEDELGAALRRTADTFRADDSRGLVAEGHAHGRRLRRRRHLTITAGVAAFAVIGVGGALLGGLAKSDGSGGVAAAPEKPVTSAAPSRTASSAKPPRPPMSAEQITDLFVSMLPAGHVTRLPGRGTDGDLPPLAEVVFDDGKGPGLLDLMVAYGEMPVGCPAHDDPGTSCTTRHIHGGILTIYKGFEYPDHRAETKDWFANFVTSAGATVGLSEWNSPQEKGAPVSRPNPPLSSARLTAIVTDPRWQRVIDALPDPSKAPGPTGKAPASTGKAGG